MNRRVIIAILISLTVVACAATHGQVRQSRRVPAMDLLHGLALEGYDPVAYFEVGQPQPGQAEVSYLWQGAEWRFANAARRSAFMVEPTRYAPQYGNYCAFAVSRGTTAHGDPKVWAIVDAKLYLNNNRFAQQLWDEDRASNIDAANQNWPLLPKQPLQ